MKKKILLIMILFVSIIIVGCGKKEINYEKHLTSFSYSYGNYKEGFNDYSINSTIYTSSNSSNAFPYIEKEIDSSILNKFENIIKKYNVLDWDGFNKHEDLEENDEIVFSIQLGYDDGSNYNASGYMKYPENFNEVHKELLRIFDELNN